MKRLFLIDMRLLLAFLLLSAGMSGGCVAYELDYTDVNYAEFRVEMDWSLCPDGMMTDGATVLFYPSTGLPPQTLLISGSSATVRLAAGSYSVIAFNQTFGDFSTIAFSGRERYDTFEAHALYPNDTLPTGERPIAEPELLASASIERLEVTPTMIEETRTRVKSKSRADAAPLLSFRPRPVVAVSSVSLWVEGLCHVRTDGATGTLRGLAGGVLMASRRSNTVRSALTFGFTPVYPPTSTTDGTLEARIYTFGLPDRVLAADAATRSTTMSIDECFLDTRLVLKDKEQTVVTSSIVVTDKVKIDSTSASGFNLVIEANNPADTSGVDTPVPPVPVPPVKHDEESGSGFDAVVGDWGDEEVVEVPI